RKCAEIAKGLAHTVAASIPYKKPAKSCRRHFTPDNLRVDAATCDINGFVADVCSENLHERAICSSVGFSETHPDRIGLFSAGASGDPDSRMRGTGKVCKNLWNYSCLQNLEHLGVTEELCDGNQKILVQDAHFPRVHPKNLEIIAQSFALP